MSEQNEKKDKFKGSDYISQIDIEVKNRPKCKTTNVSPSSSQTILKIIDNKNADFKHIDISSKRQILNKLGSNRNLNRDYKDQKSDLLETLPLID